MSLQSFAEWLDGTPASLALKESALVIPLVQSVHILAVTLVVSGALLVLLYPDREGALAGWTRALVSRQWLAFAILLASGAVLAVAEPTRELLNPVFQAKLVLVAIAVALSTRLARVKQTADAPSGHLLSWSLLALWIAIVFAGRWIAYV